MGAFASFGLWSRKTVYSVVCNEEVAKERSRVEVLYQCLSDGFGKSRRWVCCYCTL